MSHLRIHRPADILLAEDNDNDVELMRISLKSANLSVELHRVADGEECMGFLRRQGRYAKAPAPDLLILDLNMPRMSGQEVLEQIVNDERLCQLPVVILSTSSSEEEIVRMYKLRCSSFVLKPIDFAEFSRVMRTIVDYWFGVVVLPRAGEQTHPSPFDAAK